MFSLTEEQKAIKKATYLEGREAGEPVLACIVKFWVVEEMLNVINEAI